MYKAVKFGKCGIEVRLVADSKSYCSESRISTFELIYHRYIHGEVMTHRSFGRNAMSSRAVPVKKMIASVNDSPATPIQWGAKQSGMQADNEHENPYLGEVVWNLAKHNAISSATAMDELGFHKQIVNRLIEPFHMMKTVLTATEFNNFLWLRVDAAAQPEIYELARLMKECLDESTPVVLQEGEYHTPYVEDITLSVEDAIAISSSCCAQVSYRNIDNTYEKAMSVYERLGVGGNKIHASPFEHVATPMTQPKFTGEFDWEEGATHLDKLGNYWSGNLKGFIQHRQTLTNHCKLG